MQYYNATSINNLSSIYPRWSKTADAQGQLYHVNQKVVDKNLRQLKLVRRK